MQKSNAPIKLTVAFASGSGAGPVNTIPLTTNPTTGGASYQTGFTSVNMEPIASGGVPPYGADVNGLFQNQTKAQIWQQAGYMYPFDATFAGNANIGGYPAGSVLMMGSGKGVWLNQSDNNTTSPDTTGSVGWLGMAAAGTSTITTTGGTTTPDPSVLGVTTLIVTGALTSNATLVLPLTGGARWIVVNNTTGSYTLTVQGSSGSGTSITSGAPIAVFTDGTNYYGVSANLSGAYLPIGGTAVAATKLANARNFSISGLATATAVSFDGTGNIVLNVTALAPTSAQINTGLGYTAANDANVVHTSGTETINGAKTFGNLAAFLAGANVTTSGAQATITLTDTGGNGANLQLIGDGGTTPNKTIRAHAGRLEFINSAYSAVIGSMDDGGTLIAGQMQSSGVGAGFQFADRSSPSNSYQWYSTGLVARLTWAGTGDRLTIDTAGNLVAVGTVRGGSDARVKINVAPIVNALDIVRHHLQGVEYDRIDDNMRHEAGFIAQKVRRGLPHLVGVSPLQGFDDFHTMDYDHAVPYLAAAITELHDLVLGL
ncbi:MAG: tail fiber domain-containing protein [Candidatus Saccharibacteria bacterium]